MKKLDPSVAQQIAQAASAFEQRRTGHTPQSVAVILSENTLVITLHGALSPAETALAQSPGGAARLQELCSSETPLWLTKNEPSVLQGDPDNNSTKCGIKAKALLYSRPRSL